MDQDAGAHQGERRFVENLAHFAAADPEQERARAEHGASVVDRLVHTGSRPAQSAMPPLACHSVLVFAATSANARAMQLRRFLRASRLLVLLAIISHPLVAADSAAQINAKLKAGSEVAWLIEKSTDKDRNLAVLFTARLKSSKPAKFPYLIEGEVRPAETDALNAFDDASGKVEDSVVMENVIVSLKEKRVLGRMNLGKPEDQVVYFPGRNHGSLEVLWGPEEEGWHFGVLNFGGKWESNAVILVETTANASARSTSRPSSMPKQERSLRRR